MIVDTHVHVMSNDRVRYPMLQSAPAWATRGGVSTDELIPAMDAAGVDRAILVQAVTSYAGDNAYHADRSAHRSSQCGAPTEHPCDEKE